MSEWAPLDGWTDRGDGWLTDPEYEGWLRSSDGRWWDVRDYPEAKPS
jgi:hypothetical protein